MPLIPLVAVLLFVIALLLAMPLSLFLRYRVGTARRLGRRWVATLNLVMLVFSAVLFLCVAAITKLWVSDAFRYALLGLMGGCLLGLLGLALTRWEQTPQALYYTPHSQKALGAPVGLGTQAPRFERIEETMDKDALNQDPPNSLPAFRSGFDQGNWPADRGQRRPSAIRCARLGG